MSCVPKSTLSIKCFGSVSKASFKFLSRCYREGKVKALSLVRSLETRLKLLQELNEFLFQRDD